MNKKFILIPLIALSSLGAMAQRISTEQEVIDCGQVVYRKPVTAVFELKNKGFSKLQINEVRTSCGCTAVDYPQTEIPSGDSFKVKATYDAKQLGHFEKQIGIYSNASKKPMILTLRGVVVDEIVDFSGDYPFTVGSVRTDKNDIEFDDVNRGERPFQKIHLMNSSTHTVQPVMMHLPAYLSARISPSTIAPGHSGEAIIMLDSRKLRDLGLTQTSVYLGMFPGDKVSDEKEISVSAVLLPGFANMSENDKQHAPKIQLSSTSLNLGAFDGKKKLKGEILIQNVGKSRLDISSLQMFTAGMQVSLNKTKLQPGETTKLKISVEAEMLKTARSQPRVLMITNDPSNAKVVITVEAK
jgi:hypothetical protein